MHSLINPSIASIFTMSMIFPQYVSHGALSWSGEWWHIAGVFFIGFFVSFMARTLWISLGYLGTYIFFSFLISFIFKIGMPASTYALTSAWTWILGLFSFGSLLHIFHVITDPQSGPKKLTEKVLFGSLIAIIELILKAFYLLNSTIIAYVAVIVLYQLWELYKDCRGESEIKTSYA